MAEVLVMVVFSLMGIVLWALVGHGIWIALRAVFGSLNYPRRKCPACGREFLGATCSHCATQGRGSRQPTASVGDDLQAAERLIKYARFKGWVDEAQHASNQQLLSGLKNRVYGTAPPIVQADRREPSPLKPSSAESLTDEDMPSPGASEAAEFAERASTVWDDALVEADLVEADLSDSTAPPAQREPSHDASADKAFAGDESSTAVGQRRPLGSLVARGLLQRFMEKSNIRWVELISAVLIVVCSIGLVISLWSTLSSTSRFFPSLVFLLATAAVHGAGQYTLRQWKLRSTSRGILHIGLMLIPLAVLVGILLSRRDDALPQLDAMTWTTLAIGTLVYGGLAWTASRALFPRRWPVVAATTVIGCLTLVAVHFATEYQQLGSWSAWLLPWPIVLVTQVAAISTSCTSSRRAPLRNRLTRRMVGVVVQTCFAAGVVVAFWGLAAHRAGGLSSAWWMMVAVLSAAWIGWSQSLWPRGRSSSDAAFRPRAASAFHSGLLIAGWSWGAVCALLLLMAVWQNSAARWQLMTLLCLVAVAWMLHGWLCKTKTSLTAGLLALLVAGTLLVEGALLSSQVLTLSDVHVDVERLSWIEWISCSRSMILSVMGLLCVALGVWWTRRSGSREQLRGTSGEGEQTQRQSTRPSPLVPRDPPASGRVPSRQTLGVNGSIQSLATSATQAGSMSIVLAAVLALLATLTPWGATPYGGNWAPLMLAIYGVSSCALAVYLKPRWCDSQYQSGANQSGTTDAPAATTLIDGLMPIGLGLLLLSILRLCQTSPMLAGVLSELRPNRAWGVGLTGLATLWSLAAGALRLGWVGDSVRQRSNTHWLAGGALAASVASLPAVWQWSEHYSLACWVGWTLPTTCLALWFAWQHNAWRELTLLVLCGWVSSVVLNVGDAYEWWSMLGRIGAPVPFVLAIAVTTFAFEAVMLWSRQRAGQRQTQEKPAFEDSPDNSTLGGTAVWWPVARWPAVWWSAPPHWGSLVAIAISWLLLLQALLPQAVINIADSLGLVASVGLARLTLISPPKDYAGLSALILAAMFVSSLSLSALGVWLGRARQQWWLVSSIALLPVCTALLMSLAVAPAFALTAALWGLAGWILLSELLPLHGHRTAQLSHVAWQRVISSDKPVSPKTMWLVLARAVAVGLLLLGSGAYLLAALWETLPPAVGPDGSASWAENLWRVSTMLAPLLLVVSLRWCVSLFIGQSPNMISLAGGLSALTAAALIAISHPLIWPDTGLLFAQSTAVVATVVAWLTILWPTLRNFLGLRTLTQGRTPARELLLKSMKGRSWKQAEQASWSLVCLAFVNVLILGVAAAGLVVAYPAVILPGLGSSGSWFGGSALAITLALFSWLAVKRGAPRFGLLAVALGLIAPLLAAGYANHLIANPLHRVIGAENFEPYRMLLVLWLIALGIGFSVRLVAMRMSKAPRGDVSSWFSPLGEAAWLLLAFCVGSLALVSVSQDPNRLWPLAELSALALVGVLSGVASGQAWRGHLAAIAAVAGLWGWLVFDSASEHRFESLWCVLWGPVWVAAVAWAFTLWLRPQSQSRWTIDRSVSLHVPVASAVLSFVWILQLAPQVASELTWSVVAMSVACLALACARLWDVRPGKRGLAVYLNLIALALVGSVAVSAWYELPELQAWLLWMAAGLGAMAVMAGLLREWVEETPHLAPVLGLGHISTPLQLRHALTWMSPLHACAGLLALVPSIVLVLTFEDRALRIAATVLPLLGACAILPIASGRGRLGYRYCGLLLTTATLVLLSWADLPQAWGGSGSVEAWWYIQRVFAALVVLGGIVYPWLAHWLRRSDQWELPLMASGWVALGMGTVCGLVLLSFQIDGQWRMQAARAALGTKLLSVGGWSIVIGRLLQFAARPAGLDRNVPVGVRKAAVYAAQIGCGILVAVIYAHFPRLFSGVLAPWWPIILFGIAMLSAGLGEWLSRAGQSIIADPVQRSSLFLPVIPLVGVWWIEPENSIWLWREWQSYWLLLLIAAGLFGLHGWLRRSIQIRVVSGMLLLASFWVLLHSRPSLRFLEHPQLWLLPPALATLIFVEWNRRRLEPNVATAARYGAVLVAYLSSTSEILLGAFDGQLWQPLLLLILALAGIAAGIALQVRAFLYCGVAFTLVALLAMVWHAQQAIGQVWPWWAFGIATGIGLIILLGYFEKNRPCAVAYLERLKQWD